MKNDIKKQIYDQDAMLILTQFTKQVLSQVYEEDNSQVRDQVCYKVHNRIGELIRDQMNENE